MTELTSGAWALYCYLARCRNGRSGQCNPSVEITSSKVGIHPRNVMKMRAELRTKGWATFEGDRAVLLVGFTGGENTTGENTTGKNTSTRWQKHHQDVAKTPSKDGENASAYKEEPAKEPAKEPRERESISTNGRARSVDPFETEPAFPRNDLVPKMSSSMRQLAELCNFHPDLITPLQFNSLKVQAERLEKARGFNSKVLGKFRDYWEGKLAKRAPLKPEYVTEHFGNYLVWLQSNGTSNGYHP